jgi:hypothetical protein
VSLDKEDGEAILDVGVILVDGTTLLDEATLEVEDGEEIVRIATIDGRIAIDDGRLKKSVQR